jgi:hypothetical protein
MDAKRTNFSTETRRLAVELLKYHGIDTDVKRR